MGQHRSNQGLVRMRLKAAFSLFTASLSLILGVAMSGVAFGQSDLRAQQQAACQDDAYRLCPDEIPDEALVTNCMARQKSKLSPACRVFFQPARRKR